MSVQGGIVDVRVAALFLDVDRRHSRRAAAAKRPKAGRRKRGRQETGGALAHEVIRNPSPHFSDCMRTKSPLRYLPRVSAHYLAKSSILYLSYTHGSLLSLEPMLVLSVREEPTVWPARSAMPRAKGYVQTKSTHGVQRLYAVLPAMALPPEQADRPLAHALPLRSNRRVVDRLRLCGQERRIRQRRRDPWLLSRLARHVLRLAQCVGRA